MRVALGAAIFAVGSLWAQTSHPALSEFEKRVDSYMQLRKSVESKMPSLKATPSQEKISNHEQELAQAIRNARKNAKQGDIFTPEIAAEFRRLLGIALQPRDGKKIKQSLQHAEPVQLHLRMNDSYPAREPRQSTPPSLLENLPHLPMDIEYRIAGPDLVLLDTKANLIIDLLSGVFS
jgi:hypothetical protein